MDTVQDHQDYGPDGQEALSSHLNIKRQPTGLPSPPSTVYPEIEGISRPGSADGDPVSDVRDSDSQPAQEDRAEPKPYPLPPPNGTKEPLAVDANTPTVMSPEMHDSSG